jgi:hypothetical protein
MFIPDLDLDFLLIPDPGVKKAPDLGSRIRISDMVCWIEDSDMQERPKKISFADPNWPPGSGL